MKDKKALFTSNSDEWGTPQDFFDLCVEMFGEFNFDAAATLDNRKCDHFCPIGG